MRLPEALLRRYTPAELLPLMMLRAAAVVPPTVTPLLLLRITTPSALPRAVPLAAKLDEVPLNQTARCAEDGDAKRDVAADDVAGAADGAADGIVSAGVSILTP